MQMIQIFCIFRLSFKLTSHGLWLQSRTLTSWTCKGCFILSINFWVQMHQKKENIPPYFPFRDKRNWYWSAWCPIDKRIACFFFFFTSTWCSWNFSSANVHLSPLVFAYFDILFTKVYDSLYIIVGNKQVLLRDSLSDNAWIVCFVMKSDLQEF